MRKLIIKESKWYRGLGSGSRLLVPLDGRMCCLGFDSLACGATEQQILGVTFPSNLVPTLEKQKWLYICNPSARDMGSYQSRIAEVNDDRNITESERKNLLSELFREGGNIELVFVP
jgi:hypothetical protein